MKIEQVNPHEVQPGDSVFFRSCDDNRLGEWFHVVEAHPVEGTDDVLLGLDAGGRGNVWVNFDPYQLILVIKGRRDGPDQ